jgi:hypothetical protein
MRDEGEHLVKCACVLEQMRVHIILETTIIQDCIAFSLANMHLIRLHLEQLYRYVVCICHLVQSTSTCQLVEL